MTTSLDRAMTRAVEALNSWPSKSVRLFHHNDADGLCSAAILSRVLARTGYDVAAVCLEKPYPPILENIFQADGGVLVFADFAGHIAPRLSRLNQKRNLVLILDHHPARAATDPWVHNLNPNLYGYRGDRDVSASTTCWRFAEILDPGSRDLAYLAVTGAVGDGFYVEGRLAGLNRQAAETAAQLGQLEIRSGLGKDEYIFQGDLHSGPVTELATNLDILGAMGFFQGGPQAGIQVCLQGWDDDVRQMCANLEGRRETLYQGEIALLRSGGLKSTGRIQWLHVANRFNGIGVKMIGDFCRFIRKQDFVAPDLYIAGFQPVPDMIPGMGTMAFDAVKVSMRVPPAVENRIRGGLMPGLDRLLPEATRAAGGFVDACHSLAAATTIAPGKEPHLVATLDRLARDQAAPRR